MLKEDERCPFLNEKGLCDIIITLGEEALCQVCNDHPRFRSFFEHRTEIGLGLCCEAAAKLILEKKTKTEIVKIEDDGEAFCADEYEEKLLEKRRKVFGIFQNREIPVMKRIENALEHGGAHLPEWDFSKWAEIFLGLERLDPKWTELLENMKKSPDFPKIEDETAAEQLLCYFTYRHFLNMEEAEACKFIVLSFLVTEKAAEQVGILEAARLYSSEIEYSDENIEALLETLGAERI